MIDINQLKQIQDQAKESIKQLSTVSDEILKKLNEQNPEQFAQICKDMDRIKQTKDLSELQKIMNDYASKYKQQDI